MYSLVSPLHSNPAVQFLHEVEAVRGEDANVEDVPAIVSRHCGHVVHQSGEILHSEVVSVISSLVTQSLQYFSEHWIKLQNDGNEMFW